MIDLIYAIADILGWTMTLADYIAISPVILLLIACYTPIMREYERLNRDDDLGYEWREGE